ncbi:MAG: TraR/DksA C4-type zinc finger protein [Alphaproteobacteria bacterium]|nr:TraR/DksA C4-type zinc finger protein [Alphaproteobacteria bacterium]MDP1671400.1 TraR/DksA C4-type zinc finger protein [Alphaproteobacteria bacterium]
MSKKKSDTVSMEQWKTRLLAMRADVEALLAGHEEPRAQPESDQEVGDRSARAEAVLDHEMAAETTRRRHTELHRIDAALKRLEDGAFGDCVTCDQPVSPERLNLDPATPFCIHHAK